MLKDVICKLDYSNFEEIALVIFGLTFLAICWQAFRMTNKSLDHLREIPIDDLVPVYRTSPPVNDIHSNHQKGLGE